MGQQSLIYAFVARGTVILAEYTEFTGNFTTIASQCLMKLPASNNKFTYNCDGHTFNYLVEDGFSMAMPDCGHLCVDLADLVDMRLAYCVVAVESVGQQIPIAFMDRVKEDFTKRYGGGKAATAAANSLNREFGSKLKEHMQYCVDHPEEVSKLAKVKAQVSEVKGVMMENIEKVLDRGEKIELLVDKTENLRSQVFMEFLALRAGTRFQTAGNKCQEKDVVTEHENQAHRPGNNHRTHSDHYPLCLSWFQMPLSTDQNTDTFNCTYYTAAWSKKKYDLLLFR
ncbi:Vesicle-associated membrane protein 722 [Zea mays]|uniref:Vesicle-associated membrane protein 722 n=1 Tax=Zea mays TaxID=4577 RepID=A0A1D6L851_MAIZE|nr:Vesicle-associated membrane protein 722 [Zea mays]